MTLPFALLLELAFGGLPPLAGLAVSPQGGLFATTAAQGGLVIQIFGRKSWTALARTGGQPRGLAFDGAGDLYVADNALGRILRITPWGETRVAASRCGGAPIVARTLLERDTTTARAAAVVIGVDDLYLDRIRQATTPLAAAWPSRSLVQAISMGSGPDASASIASRACSMAKLGSIEVSRDRPRS